MKKNILNKHLKNKIFKKAYRFIKDTKKLIKNHKNKKNKSENKKTYFDEFIEKTEKNIKETIPLEYKPLISFIIFIGGIFSDKLKECIESILNQTYDNYEIIIIIEKSLCKNVYENLKEYKNNPKIKIIYSENDGKVYCLNMCVHIANGEYAAFTDCKDVLPSNAVFEITKALNKDKTLDFIYGDEDKITEDGNKRFFPMFKPDWSPDTLMSCMYTGKACVYRLSLIKKIGGFREGFRSAMDYDFVLRFTENTNRIGHIPKILYHRREESNTNKINIKNRFYDIDRVKKAKKDALERRRLEGTVSFVPEVYQFKVTYKPINNPSISIIIPSNNNFKKFKQCVLSIASKTEYKNYEIIAANYGYNYESAEKYSSFCEEEGFKYQYIKTELNLSEIRNKAAKTAEGDYLLFLSDNTEVIKDGWLEDMLGHACLKHVGAVGAKLISYDGKIKGGGIINRKEGPIQAFKSMNDNIIYYAGRNRLDYNYIALTASCMCLSREKFELAGGFDERFKINYGDADLCFSLYEKGFFNVVRADALLYHCETEDFDKALEGSEKLIKSEKEKKLLYQKHPALKSYDPFYNINFDCDKTDFSL